MFAHYLTPLFAPQTLAVFGASERSQAVGTLVFSNLLEGGFHGQLFPINPKHQHIQGVPCFPNLAAIGKPVAAAVVATPAATVPGILEQCGQAGTRSVIILSAGFGEAGPEGKKIESRVLAIARRYRMRLLGPNCLGLMRPSIGLNATFGKSGALPGDLALVSQSGALCTAILDWAESSRVGFSAVVSLGDAANLDFGEVLDFLATDAKTRSILLYVEGIRDARRFLSGLRVAARIKPVIVMKAGRHPSGSRAAMSHTGAMVGADDVFDAALDRAGAVRVGRIEDLFSAARTLSDGIHVTGKRIAVITNGGGPGVIAADAATAEDLLIPELSSTTITALNQVLPPHWSHGNPVDLLGDSGPDRYEAAVELAYDDPAADALLVMLTPQAMTDPEAIARAVIAIRERRKSLPYPPKPLICCWMGRSHVEAAHRQFEQTGIPSFYTPEEAVAAIAHLWHYHRHRDLLLEVPGPRASELAPRTAEAQDLISKALAAGRSVLTPLECRTLLSAYHIPVSEIRRASSPDEAAAAAEELGYPVVMKIESPSISHKSDVGGVELNLRDAMQVRRAYSEMIDRVRSKAPSATIQGVTLERQWNRAHTRELLTGVVRDPVFGPVIVFGWGGTAVEAMGDRAVCLPPLNSVLIQRMIRRTRVSRLLGPFRNLPAIDGAVLEGILLRLSELVCDLPEIQELEINPLGCDENGACVLDVRVSVSATPSSLTAIAPGRYFGHLAIPPYPKHLAREFELRTGETVIVRPIRPEDAEMEQRFVQGLSPEAKYLRFMQAVEELTPEMLVRFTQIDYDREMAFVAILPQMEEALDRALGIARYVINPDGESCEFAIVVDDAWQRRGVGSLLMTTLMAEAKSKGLRCIEGQVLAWNSGMLDLVRSLGFTVTRADSSPDENDVVVSRDL